MRKSFSSITFLKSVLFFFLLAAKSFSQTYSFDNYTVQDGIVQSNVSAIVQDNSGDIWLGTESGVSRFNGKTFQNYSTDDGLADNNITAILLDRKGFIWFAHANGDLTKYNGEKFEAIQSDQLPKEANIFALYQDKAGRLWVCSAKFGAIVIQDPYGDLNDKSNYKRYTSKDGLSEFCFSAFDDQKGNMWFLTDVGIKILNAQTGKFDFFRVQGLPATYITSFFHDKNGLIWLGLSNGNISTYDPKTTAVINYSGKDGLPDKIISPDAGRFPSSFVNAFAQDNKGNIWAAIWDKGVVRFNPGSKTFIAFNTQSGLSINKIKCITHDREGNILFGTLSNGLAVFKGEKFVSFTKTNGLINNQVWAIVKDKKGRYWWGTNEGIS
ncbi:MAG: ligand-binding sensor domain-containing protein, partial [Bacteroidota bacterium]